VLLHLSAALERIEALNAYVHGQQLRQFQHDILKTGAFHLVSPFTGDRLECVESRLIAFINDPYHFELPLYAYRFEDRSDIWVMSFQIGLGFPLCALFIEEVGGLYVHRAPAAPNSYKVLKRLWREFETLNAIPSEETGLAQPLAMIGHPNFAHYMWNELPALNAALRDRPVETRSLFAPLGPLEGLPRPAAFKPLKQSGPPYFTPVGGEFLDQRTQSSLTRQMPTRTVLRSDKASPVIWVAHREDGRSCENFLDMLAAFDRQARELCQPRYIFDSFSAPDDLDAPWYDPVRDAFESRRRQSETLFQAMSGAVSTPEAVLATTAGLTVMQAMALAREADYYISPIGSIQHKVAWLQPIPGLVHGPSTAMNRHVAQWHGQKSEVALAPTNLPSELIRDTRASAHHPSAERNMDYRITDPEAAAAFALAHLRDVLSL